MVAKVKGGDDGEREVGLAIKGQRERSLQWWKYSVS